MHRWLIGLFVLPLGAAPPWALPPLPAQMVAPDARAQRVYRTPLTLPQPAPARLPAARVDLSGGALKFAPAAKPCAVPLTNMLRFHQPDSPMPKIRPAPDRFKMREFPLPAPSCEDKERK